MNNGATPRVTTISEVLEQSVATLRETKECLQQLIQRVEGPSSNKEVPHAPVDCRQGVEGCADDVQSYAMEINSLASTLNNRI